MIDLCDVDFTAAKRFSTDRHLLTGSIGHNNIDGIRMNISFFLIRSKRVFQSVFCSNLEGIPDSHIISGKSHDSSKKCAVSTVSVIGSGERAVENKFYFCKRSVDHLLCKISNACRTGSVRTGRTDHIRPHNIKNADKRHFK